MPKPKPEVTKDYIKSLKSASQLQKLKLQVRNSELRECIRDRIREISLDFYYRRKDEVPKNQRSAKELFDAGMRVNSPSSVRSIIKRNKNILSINEIRALTKRARELDAISYEHRKERNKPKINKDSKQYIDAELEKWLLQGNKIVDCDEIIEKERLEIESRPLPKDEVTWTPKYF